MENQQIIGLVVGITFIYLLLLFVLIFNGVSLCKKNNPWGVLLFFVALNILGLIIAWILLYNHNKKEKKYYMIK